MSGPANLSENWVHLGLGASAEAQPPYTGLEWYAAYAARTAADGAEGRLVSMHRFTANWGGWEMHPVGSEMIICTSGRISLIQESSDGEKTIDLGPGDYAINDAGIWHTANIDGQAEAIFITAGQGTEHRPR